MKEGREKRKGKRKGKGEDMPNWAPEQSEQFLVTPPKCPDTLTAAFWCRTVLVSKCLGAEVSGYQRRDGRAASVLSGQCCELWVMLELSSDDREDINSLHILH